MQDFDMQGVLARIGQIRANAAGPPPVAGAFADRLRTLAGASSSEVDTATTDMALGVVHAAGAGGAALGVSDVLAARTVTLGRMLGLDPVVAGALGGLVPAGPLGPTGPAFHGVSLVSPLDAPTGSGFGPRVHPVTGEHRDHLGIDRAAPTGTPIRAAAGGVVTFAGDRGGYGNLVEIDHGNGVTTRYAHQDTVGVSVGQAVAAGAVIGTVGSTGMSTGPHLHFELRHDGVAVDPTGWVP